MKLKPLCITAETIRAGRDGVFAFVRSVSARQQIMAALLAISASLIGLVPIELQRRIIDNAIRDSDIDLLYLLGGLFIFVVLLQQVIKSVRRLYQAWLIESVAKALRNFFYKGVSDGDLGPNPSPDDSKDASGTRVTVLGTEIDKLSGFLGEGPSNAAANIATLAGTLAYTFWMAPKIALIGLLLLTPQIIIAPLMQKRVNRLMSERLSMLRSFGQKMADMEDDVPEEVGTLYRNRLIMTLWKALMKAALNIANQLAPLGILMIGGYYVIQGQATLGVVISFTAAFNRMSDPARELLTFYRQAEQAKVQHCLIVEWADGRVGKADEKN